MYSILCHWVCILMFKGHLVECVGWWEFVCELSETLNSMYSFCRIFWEWDEWPSLKSSRSLSLPSLRSLLMWLHSMFDMSWSLLLFVLFASPSFSFLLLIHHLRLTPCSFLCWHISILVPFLHHHCKSHYQFDFLHCLVIVIIFTLGTLGSMAHDIFYTCYISYMRAWVLIIGYLGLFSLHFYHPITPAYVTSHVLKPPWGHRIRCRFRQPQLGQVFAIWSIFGYHHASSSGRRHLMFGPDSIVDLNDWDYTFDYGWFEVIQFSDLPYTYAILGHISLSIEIYKSSWSHMILTTHGMHDELIVYCYLIMIP